MVRVLSLTSLALAAVSAVSGLVVPRLSPPKGWETDILEVCPPFGSLELFSRARFAALCTVSRTILGSRLSG